MSTPSSVINICSGVQLHNDYKHTIWFENQTKQHEYFAEKVVKTFSAYSYLRKSWSIKVEATMELARTWSYLYFKNGSGKTYFYFINNIEYVNDNTVELFLEMDVIQTYLFDFELAPCFIERQHTETDELGDNTVRENVDLGEIVIQDDYTVTELNDLCILIQSTINPRTTTKDVKVNTLGSIHHGVFSGMGIYAVEMKSEDVTAWANRLIELNDWGLIDCIVNMWMYPKKLVTLTSDFSWGDGKICKAVGDITPYEFFISPRWKIEDEYEPRNKKLLTYPYNFLYCTNNSGDSACYHFERFGTDTCNFKVTGAIAPDGTIKMYPFYYKGCTSNYEEGISLGDYPTCAWNSDTYKLWLAQNRNSQGLGIATGLGMMVVGAGMTLATSGIGAVGGVGTFVTGVSQISSILAERKDTQVQPPQARGVYSANVNVANGKHTFTFYYKCVTKETAKIIDDFFTMYGYAINEVAKPNIHTRENFTYVKTVGCHAYGNLCVEDIRKIQAVFDNGVTFWVDGDKISQYGLSNECL